MCAERSFDTWSWPGEDGLQPLEGVVDRLRLCGSRSSDAVVCRSSDDPGGWAFHGQDAEVDVSGELR